MTSAVGEISDATLRVWEAFYESQKLDWNGDSRVFSLILQNLEAIICHVYLDCGFSKTQFPQLDFLLKEVEGRCLFAIFTAFDRFKKSMQSPPTVTIEDKTQMSVSAHDQVFPEALRKQGNIHGGVADSAGRRDLLESAITDHAITTALPHPENIKASGPEEPVIEGNVERQPKSGETRKRRKHTSVKKQPLLPLECSDMGRGKRKKFVKVHFDMLNAARDSVSHASPLTEVRSSATPKVANSSDTSLSVNDNDDKKLVRLVPEKELIANDREVKVEEDTETQTIDDLDKSAGTSGYSPDSDSCLRNVLIEDKPSVEDVNEQDEDEYHCVDDKSLEDKNTEPPQKDSKTSRKHKKMKQDINGDRDVDSNHRIESVGERTDFECDLEAPIICSVCKDVLERGKDLVRHWKEVHKDTGEKGEGGPPPNLFYCDVCHESFPMLRKFKLHYRIHSGARPHKCPQCGKGFRIFNGLRDHLMCHSKERPFTCPDCPKTFISKKLLNYHIKTHTNQIVPRVCEKCGKQYQTLLGLKLHYRVHAGIRPYKCEVCGLAFTQRCSLQMHRRLHTGDKRHVCDICGWRFNTNTALVTHKRVHTGEKPYACSQCSFKAASSSCLRDHAIVHTKEKPYFCRVTGCHKRFKRQAHLIGHLKKKHCGIKAYQCELCGKKFEMISELKHHRKSDACEGGSLRKEPSPEPDHLEVQVTSTESNSSIVVDEQGNTLAVLQGPSDVNQEEKTDGRNTRPYQSGHTDVAGGDEDGQIVIHIVTEPGAENSDIVFTEEEMAAIFRLSQQI